MLLIWRGWGLMVIVLTAACFFGAFSGAETLWGAPLPLDKRPWAISGALLSAAAAIYALHWLLRLQSPLRTVRDVRTRRHFTLERKHEFFFVPLQYWSLLLAAMGIVFFFKDVG